jgi:hypothetical protein
LLAQGRLRHAEAAGGTGEVQLLGQCHEIAQMPEFHI